MYWLGPLSDVEFENVYHHRIPYRVIGGPRFYERMELGCDRLFSGSFQPDIPR